MGFVCSVSCGSLVGMQFPCWCLCVSCILWHLKVVCRLGVKYLMLWSASVLSTGLPNE